jgi:hypothetical protein
VRSRSVAYSIKTNITTGVDKIGRLPVGALKIQSGSERRNYLIKAAVFTVIDLLVFTSLILYIELDSKQFGIKIWQPFLTVVEFISMIIDVFTFV